jgi:hypothetical protein
MRSFFYIATIFLVITLFFTSCGGNQFSDKINVLDSLSLEVERLIDSIEIADTASYIIAHKTIEKDLKHIQKGLKDTVTQEEARFLSDYKMIRKSLGNFTDKIKALHQELIYTQKQLNSLSKDLRRGYIEASKADEYFSIEVTSAQTVLEDGWSTLNNNPVYLKMYEELHPKVLEFKEKHEIKEED